MQSCSFSSCVCSDNPTRLGCGKARASLDLFARLEPVRSDAMCVVACWCIVQAAVFARSMDRFRTWLAIPCATKNIGPDRYFGFLVCFMMLLPGPSASAAHWLPQLLQRVGVYYVLTDVSVALPFRSH